MTIKLGKNQTAKANGQQSSVDSPPHYNEGEIETIDYIVDQLSKVEFVGSCKANVLKYTSRAGKKGDALVDLRKAYVYLGWAIEVLEVDEYPDKAPEEVTRAFGKGDRVFVNIPSGDSFHGMIDKFDGAYWEVRIGHDGATVASVVKEEWITLDSPLKVDDEVLVNTHCDIWIEATILSLPDRSDNVIVTFGAFVSDQLIVKDDAVMFRTQ